MATAERFRPYGSYHPWAYHLRGCFRGSELGQLMSLKTLGIVMAIVAVVIFIVTNDDFQKGFWESWND
jgi:hypothetical protein